MKTTQLVKQKLQEMPVGESFTPATFLGLGTRPSVYKALERLADSGEILRVTHGVFVRPQQTKYGQVPPPPMQVACLKANGAPVEVHGAEAARRFGLSTQVQVQPVYYTTGPTKRFMLGNLPITLRHVSARKLIAPGTNVGLAISALWYLGKEHVGQEAFKAIKGKLSSPEYAQLKQLAPSMPAWMATALMNFEHAAKG